MVNRNFNEVGPMKAGNLEENSLNDHGFRIEIGPTWSDQVLILQFLQLYSSD